MRATELMLKELELETHFTTDYSIRTTTESLLALFDKNIADMRAAPAKVTETSLDKPWALKAAGHTIFSEQRGLVYRTFIMNHLVHHRAQLGVFLRMVGVPVLDHCQDYNLVGKGVMHEGYWSTILGLPGWPAAGEEIIVQRNALGSRSDAYQPWISDLSRRGSGNHGVADRSSRRRDARMYFVHRAGSLPEILRQHSSPLPIS